MHSHWVRFNSLFFTGGIILAICYYIIGQYHNQDIEKVFVNENNFYKFNVMQDVKYKINKQDIVDYDNAMIKQFEVSKLLQFTRSRDRQKKDTLDRAKLSFKLNLDFSKLFILNTKQVFFFIVAEYEQGKNKPINQQTIFDHIITNVNDSKLKSKNVWAEYQVADESLLNQDVVFKLYYEIFPYAGFHRKYQFGSIHYKFPIEYL